ncbi:MAG TPA: bifunctional nicotinamidase/pyrazinamidase [Longimicrobiales bacterium]
MLKALLLIDIQPDFLPGGALAIADGDAILEPINQLLARDPYDLCVATQDWHPERHVSFASTHGRAPFDVIDLYGHPQTLWPDHCVQGTPGAGLDPRIHWDPVAAVIRKGSDVDADSYSGFRNNWNAHGQRPTTGLAGYLKERGVTDVHLCGLARDFCVKWSAEDAAAAGFRTTVLWDLTRPVDPGSDARVRLDLEAAGARIR